MSLSGEIGISAAAGTASASIPASAGTLIERIVYPLARDEQLLDRVDAGLEIGLGGVVELDFDDALDSVRADDHGDADVEVVDAVLAGQMRRGREHALLVLEEALGHRDRRRRGRVEGASGLQQSDDLAAAAAGALDDCIDPLRRRPAHLDEVWDRDSGDGRIFDDWHHRVAVAAEHEGGDVLDADLELLGEEMEETGAVEHSRHAEDPVVRPAREFAQRPDHRVERIGDADDEAAGRVALDA